MIQEWREVELGDVVTLQRGFDLPTQDRIEGSVPIISSSGVTGYHSEARVEGPGVVTGRYGTLGKVFYITEDFWPLNTTLYAKDFHGNDRRFVSYLLKSLGLAAYNSASSVPGVNRNTLHRIPVLLPPLPIQRRIAGILGALDDKIEVNRCINRTLEEMAQTLYKHWFVDFGPFQDGEFVDSELGEVPAGWEVVNIGSICEVVNGSTPSTRVDEYWNGDICWATPTDMTSLSSPVIFDTDRKITQLGLDSCSASLLPAGSVLVTSRATLGVTAINYIPMATNQGFKSLVCGPRVTNHFMLLHMQLNKEDLERHAGGSTYPEINTRSFKALKLVLPPSDVMQEFDRIVKPYYDQIYAHERENRKLAEIRDYLLPKLLSGEIEVPAAEGVVEGRRAGSEVSGYEQPALF